MIEEITIGWGFSVRLHDTTMPFDMIIGESAACHTHVGVAENNRQFLLMLDARERKRTASATTSFATGV